MAPTKRPLPHESADAYYRRITAAEGVGIQEAVVVEVEHPFWRSVGNIVKRWQTMMGIVALIATSSISTLKVNKLVDQATEASARLEKLDHVITTEEFDKKFDEKLEELRRLCTVEATQEAISTLIEDKEYVVSCPVLTVRGMTTKPCELQRIKQREK